MYILKTKTNSNGNITYRTVLKAVQIAFCGIFPNLYSDVGLHQTNLKEHHVWFFFLILWMFFSSFVIMFVILFLSCAKVWISIIMKNILQMIFLLFIEA